MNYINMLWIDDEASRNDHQRAIKKYVFTDRYDNKKYKIGEWQFVDVSKYETGSLEYIAKNNKLLEYDIIMLDHFLINSKDVSKSGVTWAGFLREHKVTAPIICVTAADNKDRVSREIFNEYDDIFAENDISDYFESIFAISTGFKKIMRLRNPNNVINLMKPPADDIDILKQVLPINSVGGYINARNIYKWFKTVFSEMPGFLYDNKWAATLIGIKEKSFEKAERLFKNAEYTGIFSTNNNRRWWRTLIKEIIYEKTSNRIEKLPWKAGHRINTIFNKDYVSCYKCRKLYPETMGYDDSSSTKMFVPLHFNCSNPIEDYKKLLYFEEIRQMKTGKE